MAHADPFVTRADPAVRRLEPRPVTLCQLPIGVVSLLAAPGANVWKLRPHAPREA